MNLFSKKIVQILTSNVYTAYSIYKRRLLKAWRLIIFLLPVVVITNPLFSQEILHPTEDAFVRGGDYANDNYGNDEKLIVKQGNVEDFFRMAFLKFDLSAINSENLDSVILRLFVNDFSAPMRIHVFEAENTWTESNITWNNAPAYGRVIDAFNIESAGLFREINLTSSLLKNLIQNSEYSLVLYDIDAFNQQTIFNSRDSEQNKPELVIYNGPGKGPAAPAELLATPVDTGKIILHWSDKSFNEIGFIIERKKTENIFETVDTVDFNITEFLDSGLNPGTEYIYRIRALGFSDISGYSNEASTTTEKLPEGPPLEPTGLSGESISTGQINLEWIDNSSDESVFIVERKEEDTEFSIIDSLPANTTKYSDYALNPTTEYSYRIYASNLYFDSDPTQEITLTTGSQGITYYVDSQNGDDSFSGTAKNTAWKSMERVNNFTFSPGDSLLFLRGLSWTGQLSPKGSGIEGMPITLASFGEGNKPLIDGDGLEGQGVLYLYNQSFWEISDLEIVNDAASQGLRRGVEIAGKEFGVIRHIYLRNLHVHHIKGTPGDDYEIAKRTGGIFFMVWENSQAPTRFDDILVEDCLIHDCANQGIVTFNDILGYPGNESWMSRRITNMNIRHNTIYNITKNAMILRMMDGGLVEYNLCYSTATETTGNTIFTRSSRNVICQYNEGYDNQSPDYDGSLYDADLESPGCIFQYSYSHDNAHGLYWQCTVQQDTGVIVRYNISQNDRGRIFYINYPSNGTHIYNNTVFVGENLSPVILRESGSQGGTRTYTFRNNLIINMSPTATYRFAESRYIKNRIIENNLFYGYHPASEPNDPYKITDDPELENPGSAGIGIGTTDGYKLRSSSPAIDRGMKIPGNGGTDFWGNPLYNREPDIGAHEFEGISTVGVRKQKSVGGPVLQIYPNPSQDEVTISFQMKNSGYVTLDILDSLGRKVFTLASNHYGAGVHQLKWEGNDMNSDFLKSGIYICNLKINDSLNSDASQISSSRAVFIHR
jgi:hypothetical protein